MARRRRFFFWNGKIHKVLRINLPANLVEAFRFEDRKIITLLYSDFRQHAGKALRHREAAKLIRLKPDTLNRYIYDGKIPEVQRTYSLTEGTTRGWTRWWSEQDMLNLHEFLMAQHRGHPRQDGRVTPMQHLPSRAEIIAAFNESQKIFIRTADGTEVPLFRAKRL
jgi:hypothetical protein